MEKFRKLVDQFFCIPNVSLITFVVVMLVLCFGVVLYGAATAKPMMPVSQCAVIKEVK